MVFETRYTFATDTTRVCLKIAKTLIWIYVLADIIDIYAPSSTQRESYTHIRRVCVPRVLYILFLGCKDRRFYCKRAAFFVGSRLVGDRLTIYIKTYSMFILFDIN